MRCTMVGEMNEVDPGLKEIKMKHDQWSVDWRKWDETWTLYSLSLMILQAG